jgi:WhiB family transcriptional regulator, redox-sensing transcriptional regulator
MYRPGTTAVAAGPAGFESESASEPGRSGASAAASAVPVTRQAAVRAAPRQAAVRAAPSRAAIRAAPSPAAIPAAGSTGELPCADDPELFFAESPDDVEDAKALCCGCPVRNTCLSGAQERREPWGVWGGELFLRGEVVPRKRPRGRPRKTEVAA